MLNKMISQTSKRIKGCLRIAAENLLRLAPDILFMNKCTDAAFGRCFWERWSYLTTSKGNLLVNVNHKILV